jgi:hypothetical protein
MDREKESEEMADRGVKVASSKGQGEVRSEE